MALAWEIDVKYEELISLKDRDKNSAQPIPILTCPSVNVGLSIPLAKRFYQFELHGNLTFEEWSRLEIGPRILQNAANIGVSYLTNREIEEFQRSAGKSKTRIEQLYQDRFYLLVSKDHPLAQRQSVTPAELYDEQLAMVTNFSLGANSQPLGDIRHNCTRIISYPNIFVMKQAILQENMVGILTGYAIYHGRGIDPAQYRIIPLHELEMENLIFICLLRCNDRHLRYQERILVTCIKDYFLELPDTPLPGTGVIRPTSQDGGF